MTRERFNAGMTYDEFKASMTRNRERLEANQSNFSPEHDDLAVFTNLPHALDVVVIAADWCGDVIANLPILARIAEESGKLNLRVFERDANPDLMAEYMNGPYQSIPVFAFFDAGFREVGRWIERPKSLTELRARLRSEMYEKNPEFGSPDEPPDQLPEDVRARLNQAMADIRTRTNAFGSQEVVRELREIIEGYQSGRLVVAGNLVEV